MSSSLVDVKNVTKIYPSRPGRPALDNISLSLFRGEIICLLGVNGAGKTTLSSIIATLHPPTSGDVLHNGISVYDDLYAYRRIIGLCPQKPNFEKKLTVKEHLQFAGRYFLMPSDLIKQRGSELMDKFELTQYADASPDVLSGGYKQRLLIARALMHNPSLVILDEPTVGLDVHIRHNLWNIIKELKADGVTVLLTTHYLEEAEILSDRVCILHNGKVRLIERTDKLKQFYKMKRLEDIFMQLMKEDQLDVQEKE